MPILEVYTSLQANSFQSSSPSEFCRLPAGRSSLVAPGERLTACFCSTRGTFGTRVIPIYFASIKSYDFSATCEITSSRSQTVMIPLHGQLAEHSLGTRGLFSRPFAQRHRAGPPFKAFLLSQRHQGKRNSIYAACGIAFGCLAGPILFYPSCGK